MKWIVQYFLAPLLAAIAALVGNYYLVEKPRLEQEYTKLGVDIVLQQDSPMFMRKFAYELIDGNSPVKIPDAEMQEEIERLLQNIPAKLKPAGSMTNKEAFARLLVYVRWASQVKAVCPDCINETLFDQAYGAALVDLDRASAGGT